MINPFVTLKRLLFWNYKRTAWQYDVLCLLILAFIFLTPQSWFASSELHSAVGHPTAGSKVLILTNSDGSPELDRAEIERRARALMGPQIGVSGVRPRRDEGGRVVAFEVDIR